MLAGFELSPTAPLDDLGKGGGGLGDYARSVVEIVPSMSAAACRSSCAVSRLSESGAQ